METLYINNDETQTQIVDGIPCLHFKALDAFDWISHGFSTRLGGVSSGIHESMNLNFNVSDDREKVIENYKRMCHVLDVHPSQLVLSDQTHTTNIRVVTKEDAGKGILYPKDYHDVDGLITRECGLMLVTSYADCVPLYFIDPVHKAIGLSHSGWKGTVGRMGIRTLKAMAENFDTDPKDVTGLIGPSICQDCYEVSADVIDRFREIFDQERISKVAYEKPDGKWQLDLWEANRQIMLMGGMRPENIHISGACTGCNQKLLWSHRKTAGKRGGLSAFLMIREGVDH